MTTYTEKRRKSSWYPILGFAIFAGLGAGLITFAKPVEKIDNYWTVAEISNDESTIIREVIDYDFGNESRRGIYRDVPGLLEEQIISIESPSAPSMWTIYCGYNCDIDELRIRIGNPNITITGNHRYELSYSLNTISDLQNSLVNWNAVGTGWSRSMDDVQIQVISPFDLENPKCKIVSLFNEYSCELEEVAPGHLFVQIDGLRSSQGVNIQAELGQAIGNLPNFIEPPNAPNSGRDLTFIFIGLIAIAATLFGGGISVWALRLLGRDKVRTGSAVDSAFNEGEGDISRADTGELSELVTLSFSPPEGITAHQGGILLEESVNEDHKTAWLLERAISGEIELADDNGSRVLIDKFSQRSPGALDTIFDGREKVELGEYDKAFTSGWKKLEQDLNAWMWESNLWSFSRTKAIGWLAIPIAFAVCIWAGFTTYNAPIRMFDLWTTISAIIFGSVIAVCYRAWELAVRTPKGTGLWIQIEGFRKFLSQSEAKHVESAAENGVLREYTAWAVSLGEADAWKRAFNQCSQLNPDGDLVSDDYLFATYAFDSSSDVRTTQYSSSSSSSSYDSGWSGDFGGGFDGGGGGGGGGSW